MSNPSGFKSFVSEAQIEEARRKRQEEWEKVRTDDQPLECPEEEYDPRSLFDRLQEQKEKKDAEYEEQHKLKNMVRGLESDEVDFLEFVDERKSALEKEKRREELEVLEEYRKAVTEQSLESTARPSKSSESTSKVTEKRLQSKDSSEKKSQSALLAGVIKRKPSTETKKETNTDATQSSAGGSTQSTAEPPAKKQKTSESDERLKGESLVGGTQTLQVAGILPGIGTYEISSDDSEYSSSDLEDFALAETVRIMSRGRRCKEARVVCEIR